MCIYIYSESAISELTWLSPTRRLRLPDGGPPFGAEGSDASEACNKSRHKHSRTVYSRTVRPFPNSNDVLDDSGTGKRRSSQP